MITLDAPDSVRPSTAVPYVGLRPFGPEDGGVFYGRDADARFLVDKILSARITLLYAPSGVGKSSLLRARVLGSLEEQDCRALYFDSWGSSDPAGDLKRALSEIVQSGGIADPLAGAPTMAELIQLGARDGRTMVLVLDQFEEFLINHAATGLDPLRKELAGLVRSPLVDARVVISLREEFLAAIEPFRQDIPTLFHSTSRLEPLTPAAVRDAIVNPPKQFAGQVEPELAERLIADLSEASPVARTVATTGSGDAGTPDWRIGMRRLAGRMWRTTPLPDAYGENESVAVERRTGSGTIDLPMLQLVCEHMWRAAPVVDGVRRLTLELYQTRLGGKRQILDGHIRSRMPKRWKDRLFTATLMKFLAPPSGLKISYSAADLAAYSGLDETAVERELRRLSGPETRILRQREFRDTVRFELQHDALIRHITPWRDGVLAEAAALRRLKWAGGAVAVAAVLFAGERLYHWNEVRANTDRRLADLSAMTAAEREQRSGTTFEMVASYLLFRERGTGRLEHLKNLLIGQQHLLPRSYSVGSPVAGADDQSGAGEDDAVSMRFNSSLGLDVQAFNRTWIEVAHQITGRWGIPVPARVRLVSDPDFPRAAVQIEARGRDPVLIDLEPPEGSALVSMTGAPESAWEFHRQFANEQEWRPLPALGEAWWAVPRWTLPVWRAAGLPVWSRSAYPALVMRAKFDRDPTMLLISPAVQFLVHRVGREFPCTAAEVWAARGERLKDDLAMWMGTDHPRPLLHPALVFDSLADGVDAKPGQTKTGYLEAVSKALEGNWPRVNGSETPCAAPAFTLVGFEGVEAWLPPLQPKIRIALGPELRQAWTNEPRSIDRSQRSTADRSPKAAAASPAPLDLTRRIGTLPAVTESFEHFREDYFRRSGIWLPTPALLNEMSESPSGRQLRILLLDAQRQTGKSFDVPTTGQDGIDRSIAVLGEEISGATLAWADAELAGSLARDERVGKLLKALSISITDLKLLLRAVLAPTRRGTAPGAADAGSIRDSDWLLPSLVFWKAYYTDDRAPQVTDLLLDLAAGMRRLQAQRYATLGAPGPAGASRTIEAGIQALEAGQLARAETLFGQALRSGTREEVERLFVDRYAARWRASRRNRMTAACREPTAGKLDPSLRIDVEAFLEEPDARKDLAAARSLALCLLSSLPPTVPRAKAALTLEIAGGYGPPEKWPADQAGWLAEHLLDQYDPLRDPAATIDAGSRFAQAAVRRLPEQDAGVLFNTVKSICGRPGPGNWCWPVLSAVFDARPNHWTGLDFALSLADRESVTEVQDALKWLERARSLFAREKTASPEQRERFAFWAAYVQTKVRYAVALMTSDETAFEAARRLLPELLESPAVKKDSDLEVSAVVLAGRVYMDGAHPQPERVSSIRAAASGSAGDEMTVLSSTLFSSLRKGDQPAIRSVVTQAASKAVGASSNEDRADALFVSSVGGLLTDPGRSEWTARQFIGTTHVYAPVVSMLLIARTKGIAHDDARTLLDERWARIDPATWDKRLQLGDRTAWYELLLGYFAGKVPARDLFDPLQSDATLAASRFAGLRVHRTALLTEARFYDAVRQTAAGDNTAALASLQQVIDLGYRRYIEYDMALHLQRLLSPTK